jgi:Icc protein
VRSEVRSFVKEHRDFIWLSESGVVKLTESTALIGHEAWADARYAPLPPAGVPRDFTQIDDLKVLLREQFEKTLNQLGDASAVYIRKVLREALAADYQHIILVIHVPPFKEASLDKARRICSRERLPFYSCKAVGDVLLEVMSENPDRRLTVLSGHTHEKCEVDILPNLQVKVLDAGYGTWYQPRIIKV